eukprot:TRINITY_DN2132_c0_g1_i1.p1 TRINITY_DN2132_c0_g1~~TRINITY_DN2132_c0_g1_i1.p1  ORF type:complete len:236 (-),score=20.68 TRINITY_DN2132_c0_g1_i1:27-734(-)
MSNHSCTVCRRNCRLQAPNPTSKRHKNAKSKKKMKNESPKAMPKLLTRTSLNERSILNSSTNSVYYKALPPPPPESLDAEDAPLFAQAQVNTPSKRTRTFSLDWGIPISSSPQSSSSSSSSRNNGNGTNVLPPNGSSSSEKPQLVLSPFVKIVGPSEAYMNISVAEPRVVKSSKSDDSDGDDASDSDNDGLISPILPITATEVNLCGEKNPRNWKDHVSMQRFPPCNRVFHGRYV